MSRAAEIRRAVTDLEANASWFARTAEGHGAAARGASSAGRQLDTAWRSPVATALVAELERVAGRHRPAADAAHAAAASLRALAAEGSALASRLAALEVEAAHVEVSLVSARALATVPSADPDPAARSRVRRLEERAREVSRGLEAGSRSWLAACRRVGRQLDPLLEPLRRAEREDRRRAERFAREHLDGVPGRFSASDRSDPWFRALVEARLADPLGDPDAVRRAAAEAFAARYRAGVDELLAPGWFGRGPGRDDLRALQDLVERLPAPVVDALVAGLDDVQLQRMADAVEGGGFLRSWDAARRHGFWNAWTTRISLGQVRRLAAVSEDIDPTIATAMGDAARDDPAQQAWFEQLEYRSFDGRLFALGPGDPHPVDRGDLTQGRIGNCYLIAAMMGIADHDPTALHRMIRANPNGTFTVAFADGVHVTVTPDLPSHPDEDRPAFAGRALRASHRDVDDGYELWPLLIEKAYAQRHDGWGDTVGGRTGNAVQELVGGELRELDPSRAEFDEIASALAAGDVVTIGTHPPERTEVPELYEHPNLAGQHAYVVEGIDANGRVRLVNPWDPREPAVRLTQDELRQVARRLQVNELP